MASVKIILKTNKTLANGAHPITIRIIKDRKAKFIFTGRSATLAQWDDETGLPNKKHPLYKELVIYLKKRLLDAETEILQYEKDDHYYTAATLKQTMRKSRASRNLFEYFEELMEQQHKIGEMGNKQRYKSAKNALLKFMRGNAYLDFKEVTPSFLLKYEQHLRTRGLQQSTIRSYMTPIKSAFDHAIAECLIKEEVSPFKVFDLGKYKSEPNHRALDKTKIETIFNYVAEAGSLDFHALNYFKFAYYCWGISIKDICKLKWKNIQNNRIHYHRSKTKKAFNVFILPPVEQMLEYYKGGKEPNPNSYIFPVLDDVIYNTPLKKFNRVHYITKSTNNRLKAIAKEMGLSDKVTTYTARHTFATNLRDMDISTAKIQQMLGHGSATTTQTYLDSIKTNELDIASLSLLKVETPPLQPQQQVV